MDNLEALFEKEFKNLYALEKQINSEIGEITHVENKKMNKQLQKYVALNQTHFERIQTMVQDMSINPGNTTDSVAAEMLNNLSSIDRDSNIDQKVKEAGLLSSLNRLSTYKSACYSNVFNMAKSLKKKKVSKRMAKMLKANNKRASKLNQLGKKQVFKSALS